MGDHRDSDQPNRCHPPKAWRYCQPNRCHPPKAWRYEQKWRKVLLPPKGATHLTKERKVGGTTDQVPLDPLAWPNLPGLGDSNLGTRPDSLPETGGSGRFRQQSTDRPGTPVPPRWVTTGIPINPIAATHLKHGATANPIGATHLKHGATNKNGERCCCRRKVPPT